MEALELRDPGGAFDRLEAWLRERGFFVPGGEGLAADVYLGYGLSQAIRREVAPPPPEPCPALPLLACALRSGHDAFQAVAEDCRVGTWEPTWTTEEYAGAIELVREAIARGDVYQ